MTLEKFLLTRYVEGGRGPVDYDCWGMTRDAKHALFGGRLMPTCADAAPGLLPVITRTVERVAADFGMRQERQPSAGMVATAWMGRVCVHVGLVVGANGGIRILETDKPTGPCLTRVAQFEARYSKVVYYAD